MWELDCEESWALKNWCFWTVVLEKTLESPLDCKEIQPVHPKGYQPWVFIGRTDVEAETPILWPPDVKELIHWKRPWCWERLRAGGERDDRGWDGCMASLTQWTWVWVDFGSRWWTGRPGVLRFIGSQRVGHDWATELNWLDYYRNFSIGYNPHEGRTLSQHRTQCPGRSRHSGRICSIMSKWITIEFPVYRVLFNTSSWWPCEVGKSMLSTRLQVRNNLGFSVTCTKSHKKLASNRTKGKFRL